MGQPDATGTGPPDAAGTGQTDAAGVGQLDAAGTGQPDAADAGEPDAAGTVSLMPRSGQGPSVNVAAGSGAVELVTVQSEGRAAVPAREWVNGARITGGERLGQ